MHPIDLDSGSILSVELNLCLLTLSDKFGVCLVLIGYV